LEHSRTPWGFADNHEHAPKLRALIDLISARRESYSRPAALPQVVPGSIEDDLRRRDFTINTLALRLDGRRYGEVLDPLGAMSDLERGVIRALHEASFRDDPTRMLRAVRYEQRLGFRIDSQTLLMIPEGKRWLRRVSAHRVRQELDSALQEELAARMIRRMGTLGLLRAIHSALPFDDAAMRRLRAQSHPVDDRTHVAALTSPNSMRWLLWLLDLSPAQLRSVRRRLLFDSRMNKQMLAASKLWRGLPALGRLRPSALAKRLDEVPPDSVRAVESALPKSIAKKMMQEYLGKWRTQRPITTGADLGRRGIAPGPAYREILQDLRAGWIDGEISSPAEEQLALELILKRPRSQRKAATRGLSVSRRRRA
jgi:tRNA nucleotidyltransferase (CCA-adding enzyme)